MLAAGVVTVVVVTLVHVASEGGSTCSFSPPLPSLPPRLRSLGGFDQPQDQSDTPGLESFAASAASAVAPGLIGTVAGSPVRVRALDPHTPDALIVPLQSRALGLQHPIVAGLVALLADCAGRVYYSAVDDLTLRGTTAPESFPSVSMTDAATSLGTSRPQLVYTESPFAPRWRNPDTGNTIPAFAA